MDRETETGAVRHAGRAGTQVAALGRARICMKRAAEGRRSPPSHAGACQAFIALGSNLGHSLQIIRQAIERLQSLSASPLLISSLWRTTPVDCPPGSPDFINSMVGVAPRAGETPESLLAALRDLEQKFGRGPKTILNAPRPLDLDLIAFGEEVRATRELVLPHPRAHLRRFILQPLSEIAPDLILPGSTCSVAQLLRDLPSDDGICKLD